MSAQGAFKITEDFEAKICDYTGAPYCVALDNGSSALFLALTYDGVKGKPVRIPKYTYPSVPCEIVHAGGIVMWLDDNTHFARLKENELTGAYNLVNTNVWDSALRFTADMYIKNTLMCLSFTGPYKHLKLGKGGAILTDNGDAYEWLKKARFSGRSECSYHEDDFDENPVIGWNMYMPIQTAALGLQMMAQFYNPDNSKKYNADLSIKYPDLSQFNLWKAA